MAIFQNPFPTTAYIGSRYFCDREDETKTLLRNLENGNSTTLVSLRRIGKTGLIQHVLAQLPKKYYGIYVDILETENLNHFLNLLATAIIKFVPEKSGIGKSVWEFIKTLRPLISFDNLTGLPQVSFDIRQKETEKNIDTLLNFLEGQNFKVLIAIDEFQQILNYPEKNADAWLRSRMQQLKNVYFLFSGSRQHLMTDLFTSPNRPFFRSTQMMKLEKINPTVYNNFIQNIFSEYGKSISEYIANNILEWTNTHTYFVQLVCNRVFAATKKEVTEEIWKQQAADILKEQETIFFSFRNMLTKPQWQLLKAIAEEGVVYQPTARDFLFKNNLGTSATVLRSLKSLMTYDLVYDDFDRNGLQFYSVYDVFFQRWVRSRI